MMLADPGVCKCCRCDMRYDECSIVEQNQPRLNVLIWMKKGVKVENVCEGICLFLFFYFLFFFIFPEKKCKPPDRKEGDKGGVGRYTERRKRWIYLFFISSDNNHRDPQDPGSYVCFFC